ATARSSIFALRRSAARVGVAAPASKNRSNTTNRILNFWPVTLCGNVPQILGDNLGDQAHFLHAEPHRNFIPTPPVKFFPAAIAGACRSTLDCGRLRPWKPTANLK